MDMSEINELRYRIQSLNRFLAENPTYFDRPRVLKDIDDLRAELLELI